MSYYAPNPWTYCEPRFPKESDPERHKDRLPTPPRDTRAPLEVAFVRDGQRSHAYFGAYEARRDLERCIARGYDETGKLRPLRHTGSPVLDVWPAFDYWQAMGALKVLGLMDMHAAPTVGDLMERLGRETIAVNLDDLAEVAE